MVRAFVYLLLLFVVFLSGMILGIDREKQSVNSDQQHQIESTEQAKLENTKEVEKISVTEQPNSRQDMDEPLHVTQKTASYLESGVKGFYEVIVEILYQISTLFY